MTDDTCRQRTDWHEGTCNDCGRETNVIHVDEHGTLCIVCLNQLAEQNEVTGDV